MVGFLFGYFNYQLALSLSPLAGRVSPAYELLGFLLVGGWVGLMFPRALRQALLLRRFYAEVKVNIFNTAPLYWWAAAKTMRAWIRCVTQLPSLRMAGR